MDPIKDAFAKVKQDIDELKSELSLISQQLEEVKRMLNKQNIENPTDPSIQQTLQHINPTHPTDDSPLYALKPQNNEVSIGNRGVPTNKQTNQQTNQHIPQQTEQLDPISQIQRVSDVLDSLDSIKKEIRSNFKKLTSQEMVVFSAIYACEEQGFVVDYSLISQKLSLSETSIRDYIHKMIKKGIPILKSKENNKKVILNISSELKKIASLQTILSLRNL